MLMMSNSSVFFLFHDLASLFSQYENPFSVSLSLTCRLCPVLLVTLYLYHSFFCEGPQVYAFPVFFLGGALFSSPDDLLSSSAEPA